MKTIIIGNKILNQDAISGIELCGEEIWVRTYATTHHKLYDDSGKAKERFDKLVEELACNVSQIKL